MSMIGKEIRGVWGAMFPDSEGTVVKEDDEFVYVAWQTEPDEDEEPLSQYRVNELMLPGERSVNGSPIGVFVMN